MTHYVCEGDCGAVEKVSGTCGSATCPKNGMEMKACDCTDPAHNKDSAAPESAASDQATPETSA